MLLIGQKYNHRTTENPNYISITVTYTVQSPSGAEITQTCDVDFKGLIHKDNEGKEVDGIQDGWYPGYEYTYVLSI